MKGGEEEEEEGGAGGGSGGGWRVAGRKQGVLLVSVYVDARYH